MKTVSSLATSLLLLTFTCTAACAQSSSQRLPALVRSNTFLAGQVLGCFIRMDVYLGETKQSLATSGMPVPTQLADVSTLLDIDAEAIKADVRAVLYAEPQDLISIDTLLEVTQQIALAEISGADGANAPAWVQTAGCATVMRQLGLYELYPFRGSTAAMAQPAVVQNKEIGPDALASIGRQLGACVNVPVQTPPEDLRGWKLHMTVDRGGSVVSAYTDTPFMPLANAVRRAADRCGPYDQASDVDIVLDATLIFADR
jgi:hypothetical protein